MTSELHTDRRRLLLSAAAMLANRFEPATVGVAELAEALGIAVEDFVAEFQDVEHYFAAVQMQFFEGRLAAVIRRAGAMTPGLERIRSAWSGYLDYSLEHAAVCSWCRRARQRFPSLMDEMRRRNHGVMLMIQIEFCTLGCPDAMERARLTVGAVLETVEVETEMRRKNQAMRDLLWSALDVLSRT
jgi:AcrR family transcriptional regulator